MLQPVNARQSSSRDVLTRRGTFFLDETTGKPDYSVANLDSEHASPSSSTSVRSRDLTSVSETHNRSLLRRVTDTLGRLMKRKSKSKKSSKKGKKSKKNKKSSGNSLTSAVKDVMSGATIL
jgi:hypothetical protein